MQMILRGGVVFVAGLIMVRFSDKRFFAKRNAFDLILAFLLASMLSRAINGSGPLLETLAAAFLIVALHRLPGLLACRSSRFGNLLKGLPEVLIDRGEIRADSMKRNHISRQDLIDPSRVKIARLERNGEISIILEPPPGAMDSPSDGAANHVSRDS